MSVPVKRKHHSLYEIFYSLMAAGGGGPIGVDQGFAAEGCRERGATNELFAVVRERHWRWLPGGAVTWIGGKYTVFQRYSRSTQKFYVCEH